MSPTGGLPGLSPTVLPLLRYGAPVLFAAVLPFLGVLIAGTALSLYLNVTGREHGDRHTIRLSRDLIRTVTIRPGVVFLAGVLPLPVVGLAQLLFAPSAPLSWGAWVPAFAALLSGCALVSAYRRAALHTPDPRRAELLAGLAGLCALLGGSGLLFVLAGTPFNPSKMPLFRHNPVFFLSWHSFVEFFLFLALSFGLTGGVILLALDRSPGGGGEPDPAYREYVRSVGAPFARSFSLFLPALVVLDLVSIPSTGLSGKVFASEAAILLLSPAVFLLLSPSGGNRPAGRGAPVSILYVLMFFAAVEGWSVAAGNAVFGRPLPFLVPEAAALVSEGRVEAAPPPTEATLRQGEKIFETICGECHRFDERLIGPPFAEVLPRFRGDVERLEDFVRDPVKVNAGYPEMPKVGVTESELTAVANYLLDRVAKEEAGKTEPEGTAEEGRKVFEEFCRSCHRFDKPMVGPPIDEVAAKYRGDVERLRDFLREPVRVNPAYPIMPTLPLTDRQIDVVARYLLERERESEKSSHGEEKPTGHGEGR
jgi:mono/diheme cytochrome c family protein